MTDQIEREKNLPAEKVRIETGLTVTGGLVPKDFDGLYRFCTILAASGLMPKGLEKVEAVFVAVQMGLEVGLSPMQAVQNIAPINGRPAIWGDAVLGLVRASGLLEDFVESTEGTYPNDDFRAVCSGKRKDEKVPFIREFSIADAKQAGLWCQGTHNDKLKYTPWYKYPKRMLQMRARSWALRDGFGDVLKGLRMAEEVLDYDIDLARTSDGSYSTETKTSDLSKKIKQQNDEKKEEVPKYGSKEHAKAMVDGSEGKTVRVDKSESFHQKAEEKPPAKNVEPEPEEKETPETVEENKEDSNLQNLEENKNQELNNADDFAFRNDWINKKEAGFSTFVYKNRSKFEDAPVELRREAAEKWKKLYPKTAWPLDDPGKADNEDEKTQMIKAISDFFNPDDVTQALHQHSQTTLTACDMAMLRAIYKYLRESAGKAEDLS